jgi:hypothetical protein
MPRHRFQKESREPATIVTEFISSPTALCRLLYIYIYMHGLGSITEFGEQYRRVTD